MPPVSLITFGHATAMPLRVPSKKDGTCFVHLYGVSIVQVQRVEVPVAQQMKVV